MNKLVNLVVSFISGASIMAIELAAAKLFEPKLGNSLMLWAAVIGFTMLGLAMGYIIGGRLSKKNGTHRFLILALGLASLYSFISPSFFNGLSDAIRNMGLISSIILSSFLILVPSLLLLGMISPLLIKINNDQVEHSGKTSGTVFSVSTLGGILATLFFGLYLIPYQGISFSFMLVSILLLLSLLIAAANFFLFKSSNPPAKA